MFCSTLHSRWDLTIHPPWGPAPPLAYHPVSGFDTVCNNSSSLWPVTKWFDNLNNSWLFNPNRKGYVKLDNICYSGGLELLQLVSEPNTGRWANKDTPPKDLDCEISRQFEKETKHSLQGCGNLCLTHHFKIMRLTVIRNKPSQNG